MLCSSFSSIHATAIETECNEFILLARTPITASKTSQPPAPELPSPFVSLRVSWELLPISLVLAESMTTRRITRRGKCSALRRDLYCQDTKKKKKTKTKKSKVNILAGETELEITKTSHLTCVPSVRHLWHHPCGITMPQDHPAITQGAEPRFCFLVTTAKVLLGTASPACFISVFTKLPPSTARGPGRPLCLPSVSCAFPHAQPSPLGR